MKRANYICFLWIISHNWMRCNLYTYIFLELRKIYVRVMNNNCLGKNNFIHSLGSLSFLRIKLLCFYIQMSMGLRMLCMKKISIRILYFPLSSQDLQNKYKFFVPSKNFDCCSSSYTVGLYIYVFN